jgi:predicted acylesterase/phospholipase RssA
MLRLLPTQDALRLYVRALPSVACNLLRCWAILLVPALFAAIAIGTDQGRDALAVAVSAAEIIGKGRHAYAAQAVTTVLTTIAAVIVLSRHARGSAEKRYAAYHVPGLVGLLGGLLPVAILQETGALSGEAPTDIAFYILIGSGFPPFWVIVARDLLPKRRLDAAGALVLLVAVSMAVHVIAEGTIALILTVAALAIVDLVLWRGARYGKAQRVIASLVALFAIGGAALVALDPADWGLAIGSYAMLLVALNFWLGVGCILYLLLFSQRRRMRRLLQRLVHKRRFRSVFGAAVRTVPLLAIALIAWLFFSGPFDLRKVRLLDGRTDPPAAQGLQELAHRWLAARRAEILRSGACYPIFVVNADGGGVRAAWWAASILATLQDQQRAFATRVFAISGVSGGSLGAAVFAARAAHSPAPQSACAELSWRACADRALARDLLSPTVGAMVISDAFRAVTRIDRLPDRATALEKSFERAWADAFGRDTFGEPFADLWVNDNLMRVPSLLLNATEASTGRRLVLGPVPLFRANEERADLGALLDRRSLRLSTAVLLSARFPGLSPAGWLSAPDRTDLGTVVVDGGFIDNSGATSAADAIAALRAAAEELELPKVLPVALMISNDPVPPNHQHVSAGPRPQSAFAATTFGSLVSPVMTLDKLRRLTTARAKHEYRVRVIRSGGLVLDSFDLRADSRTYPLGWMLAAGTREYMGRQIDVMANDPSSHFSVAAGLLDRSCQFE